MPGLVPGIHVFLCRKQDVDGRDKRGHDVQCGSRREQLPPVVARDCEVEDHTGFGRRRQPHQRELLRASNVRRLREHQQLPAWAIGRRLDVPRSTVSAWLTTGRLAGAFSTSRKIDSTCWVSNALPPFPVGHPSVNKRIVSTPVRANACSSVCT